ncbi:MAG: hypothetical protein K0A99_10250 [Desulfoarculaceae bacterium]|nr:hypothetical protein [Desulfoarculaceae bacterium]
MKKETSTPASPRSRGRTLGTYLIKVLLFFILFSWTAVPGHTFDITFRSSADISEKSVTLGDIADLDSHSELAKALPGRRWRQARSPVKKLTSTPAVSSRNFPWPSPARLTSNGWGPGQ